MSLKRPSAAHDLPEELPAGEHVLWQGAPALWPLARSLHLRPLLVYFALMLGWVGISRALHQPASLAPSLLRFGALSLVAVGIFLAYVALVARTTSYTITTRRLVLQAGIALPMSVNLPWTEFASAALRREADGSGDLLLTLVPGRRLSFVLLWPHARPGRDGAAQPRLRAVADIERPASLIRRRLEASLAAPPTPAAADRAPPLTPSLLAAE